MNPYFATWHHSYIINPASNENVKTTYRDMLRLYWTCMPLGEGVLNPVMSTMKMVHKEKHIFHLTQLTVTP
jgi:hypothetical protein